MKRRLEMLFTGVLLSVILCSGALAAESDAARSFGLYNGLAWEKMGDSKTTYLLGLEDGMRHVILMASTNDDEAIKQSNEVIVTRFTCDEIIKVLDNFYSDVRNVNVPIASAYIFVGKKLKGDLTPEEEADWLTRMRKVDSSNRKQP